MQLQIGDSGGIENTGYNATASIGVDGNQKQQLTSGFPLSNGATQGAATLFLGSVTLSNLSGNTWALSGNMSTGALAITIACAGAKTLSATLDRVRITTVNGTDTFDAGTINILYE
jgi:hypothetical protein